MRAIQQATIGTIILMTVVLFQNCGKLSVDISNESAGVLSSSGQAYKFTILGPASISIGQCAPYFIDRTSLSGGSLPPPTTPYPNEIVSVPISTQGMLYMDDMCTTPTPPAFGTDDLPVIGYFMASTAYQGDIYVLVSGRPTNKISVTVQ